MVVINRQPEVDELDPNPGPRLAPAAPSPELKDEDRVPKTLSTSQRKGFQPRSIDVGDFVQLTGSLGLTSLERAKFEGQKEIGFFEGASRNAVNAIPLAGEISIGKVYAAVLRLQDDEGARSRAIDIEANRSTLSAPGGLSRSFGRGQLLPDARDAAAQQADFDVIDQYVRQKQIEQVRGFTLGGKIGSQVVELPEFMVSFLLTSGIAGSAKKGASRAVREALKKKLGEKVAARVATKLAAGTTGLAASAAVRTAALPQFTVGNFLERQVGSSLVFTDKGAQVLKQARETPVKSAMFAVTDTFIEMFSEESGAAIGRGLKRLTPGLDGLRASFQKVFAKSEIAKKGVDLWTKAGWNGLINEMGEEVLGNLLRAITGVSDFGADNPEQILDRIIASIPDGEELMVMAGVLSLPAGVRMTSIGTADLIASRKADRQIKTTASTRELTDAEIQAIIEPQGDEGRPIGQPKDAAKDAEVAAAGEQFADNRAAAKAKNTPVKPAGALESKAAPTTNVVPTESDLVDRALNEGRIERLDEEQDQITAQLDRLQVQKDVALKANKGVKSIDAKMAALSKRFDAIDQEASNIQIDNLPVGASRKITTSPVKVLSVLNRKVKDGVRFTKQQIAQAQNDLSQLVKSRLPVADRGAFLDTIKRVTSRDALARELPKITQRIAQAEEKRLQRRALGRVVKQLKGTKLRKGGKGKFTPEIQRGLDRIREVAPLGGAEVSRQIIENQNKVGRDGELPFEVALDSQILRSFGDLKNKTSAQLGGIQDELGGVIDRGKNLGVFRMMVAQAERREKVEQARATMIGDKPLDPTETPAKELVGRIKAVMISSGKTLDSWRGVMDILSFFDKTSKPFKSFLSKVTNVLPNESKEKGDVDRLANRINRIIQEIYGFTSERQAYNQLIHSTKIEDRGVFKDASGQDVRLKLSKDQAIKMWMEVQDPLVRASVESEKGGYQLGTTHIKGLTAEMQTELFDEFLDVADLNYGRAQMALYQELREPIAELYERVNGAPYDKNPFYSPIARIVDGNPVDALFDEQGYRAAISAPFLKKRVENFRPLKVQGSTEALYSHVMRMSHWLNWHEKLQDINAIFGDAQNAALIEARFGRGTLKTIRKFIKDFTENSRTRAEAHDGWVDGFRKRFTVFALALKSKQIVVQSVSALGAIDEIGTVPFLRGLTEFSLHPVANTKKLHQLSDLLRTRGGRQTRDINDVRTKARFAEFRRFSSIENLLMLPTEIGDRVGVVLGGYPVYADTLRRTGSEQKAIEAFEQFTQNTQQSSDLSQQSDQQRGSPMSRVFTMFRSAINQYFRIEMAAVRNKIAGRASWFEIGRTIGVYHVVIPQVIQIIANMGKIEEEDQLRALVMGNLNGWFIFGDVIDAAASMVINQFTEEEIDLFENSHPIFDVTNEITRGAMNMINVVTGDESMTFLEALEGLGKQGATTAVTSAPTKQVLLMAEGLKDAQNGEVGKGVAKFMGWPAYTVDRRFE